MGRVGTVVVSVCWWLVTAGLGAVLVPWWLTGWRIDRTSAWWPVAAVPGVILVAGGLLTTAAVFVQFVRAHGTPMPGADTDQLVVTGPNRYVRNPVYVGATAVFAGETLVLLRWDMLAFTVIAWAVAAAFVQLYEQPRLHRRFGPEYDAYRARTRAWIPSLARPGRPRW